jgi:peptidoglycan L-alanyl-D-glutamate endopeptidase CwlK
LIGNYFLISEDVALKNVYKHDYVLTHVAPSDTVVDANYSVKQVFSGKNIPDHIKEQQSLIIVHYYGFDNRIHRGQIVCNISVADQLKQLFEQLLEVKFPIYSVIPIHAFDWDDDKSMAANNTSCFNYRKTSSGKWSEHSKGIAIDINPLQNPYIKRNGVSTPDKAIYQKDKKGTILKNSNIVRLFESINWKWGGNWKWSKDYQHFSVTGR